MTKFILAFLAFPFWALEDSGGDGEFDWVGMLVLIAVVSVIMGGQHLVQQLGKHRKEKRHERLRQEREKARLEEREKARLEAILKKHEPKK